MIRSLVGLVRGLAFLALGACAVAVVVGRLAPRPTEYRIRQDSGRAAISGFLFPRFERVPRFLDTETGRLTQAAFAATERIECAAFSPWRDDRGRTQVVGRWIDIEGMGDRSAGFGLARYTFPDGRLLDRVTLDIVPTSAPCFYPDSPAKVLFTAADGDLYRLRFDDGREPGEAEDPEDSRLRKLTWDIKPPGDRMVILNDPTWPDDPRLKGRILVSLSHRPLAVSETLSQNFTIPELWWLQIDAKAEAIVAAGRLIEPATTPGAPERGPWEQRMPSLAVAPDGGATLAYMTHRKGMPGWQMKVARCAIDPETGTPRVDERDGRVLDDSFLPITPSFSRDGRWLYGFVADRSMDDARRISVAEALDGARIAPGHLAFGGAADGWR